MNIEHLMIRLSKKIGGRVKGSGDTWIKRRLFGSEYNRLFNPHWKDPQYKGLGGVFKGDTGKQKFDSLIELLNQIEPESWTYFEGNNEGEFNDPISPINYDNREGYKTKVETLNVILERKHGCCRDLDGTIIWDYKRLFLVEPVTGEVLGFVDGGTREIESEMNPLIHKLYIQVEAGVKQYEQGRDSSALQRAQEIVEAKL